MSAVLAYVLQGVFILVVASFAVYVLLELRALRIARRTEAKAAGTLDVISARLVSDGLDGTSVPETRSDQRWPMVSVLLPMHNESSMISSLIDAVCTMHYPREQLEILVLDDSTDSTAMLARKKVVQYAGQGINIRYLSRKNRKGYKAGNLAHGVRYARGDFYAIFDADFVPPVDFLLRTIPCFENPRLGFLQTGIGYVNRDASFLTRFQAMEMGHQQVVTVGLSADGDMASLSGSSCIWRRSCVEALGGWDASVITEDVDLGYKAQISDWQYAYLRDVVSMSVLPETVRAFRMQRERWGRGLIHSAFKHAGQMFRQPMPLIRRLHATAMMFSALLLAAIYVLVLMSLPLVYFVDMDGLALHGAAMVFFGLVAVWGVSNVVAARKGARMEEHVPLARALWDTYVYIAMFLPMAWYYFLGGIRAAMGIHGQFYRTPKGEDEHTAVMPRVHRFLVMGEVFTFIYSLVALVVAFVRENYFFVPLNLTVCVAFGLVLQQSWREAYGKPAS